MCSKTEINEIEKPQGRFSPDSESKHFSAIFARPPTF